MGLISIIVSACTYSACFRDTFPTLTILVFPQSNRSFSYPLQRDRASLLLKQAQPILWILAPPLPPLPETTGPASA